MGLMSELEILLRLTMVSTLSPELSPTRVVPICSNFQNPKVIETMKTAYSVLVPVDLG